MIVSKSIEIDAAHYLPGYKGKCANLHGHRWRIEIAVRGSLRESGMVVDFSILNEPLRIVERCLDHKVINDVVENPTAENICRYVKGVFEKWWLKYFEDSKATFSLARVKIWETEDSYALLEEPSSL